MGGDVNAAAETIRRYIRNSLPHQTGYDALPRFPGADANDALAALVAEVERLQQANEHPAETERELSAEVDQWIHRAALGAYALGALERELSAVRTPFNARLLEIVQRGLKDVLG